MGLNFCFFLLEMAFFDYEKGATEELNLNGLAGRIQDGDAQAEEALLRAVLPKLARFVRVRLGKAADNWDDVTQECGLQVLLSLRQKKFDPARKIWPYILGITWHVINQYFKTKERQNRRRHEQDVAELEQSTRLDLVTRERVGMVVREIDVTTIERQEKLSHWLNELPEEQRQVLHANFLDDIKNKNIAEEMAVSAQRVADLKRSALQRLRRKLEEYYRA
ncbi:MAG: hypothetical protein ILNGONEN_01689 [Syntrophorhabdaceae bacterium]|nr:hypothetical protein [Syntrophorhabdaceae bacterium]